MKKLEQLRKELGIVSQGRTHCSDGVLIHLAFRMNTMDAERFIRASSEAGMSESLWARHAILMQLGGEHAVR